MMRLKKCSNNYGKSLPERRQRLSAGIVKRIDEAFPRFYLMYCGGEGAVFFECRDSAIQKLMILMEKQPTTKKFCPSENDRRSGAGFPLSAFGHRGRNQLYALSVL